MCLGRRSRPKTRRRILSERMRRFLWGRLRRPARGKPAHYNQAGTLAAGTSTPLWNQLVGEVLPLLKRRGEKAQLARLLGVTPRPSDADPAALADIVR